LFLRGDRRISESTPNLEILISLLRFMLIRPRENRDGGAMQLDKQQKDSGKVA
jgi:hypothetical protein